MGSRTVRRLRATALSLWVITSVLACSGQTENTDIVEGGLSEAPASQAEAVARTAEADTGPLHFSLSSEHSTRLDQWTGDLDGMVDREVIRALVVYSLTNYFLDGATQRGVSYEMLKEFEQYLNQQLGRRTVKVHVVIIPVRRDQLLPALNDGIGDIAAANLTITPERQETVAFSAPFASGIRELVVTGPGTPPISAVEGLSGMEIHVRQSSSYWDSLLTLNAELSERGLEPVRMVPAEEYLEDEDLLELVHTGVIPAIVMDSHKARFWAQIFEDIVVHDDAPIRTGGQIAWAFRKNSPQLEALVNRFVKGHKKGTLFGNVILKRYFQDNTWVKNNLVGVDWSRFQETVALFQTYGDQYNYDHLLLAALAYQESGLDQAKRSRAGAIGVMQMLPSTAADPNVGITHIDNIENNIHAGTKYLRFIQDRYFNDPDIPSMDQVFFTFAAYNAGPAKIHRLRSEAAEEGFDPNRWFGNVEVVAARRIGRETVQYVSNITKYYIAYQQAMAQLAQKEIGASTG